MIKTGPKNQRRNRSGFMLPLVVIIVVVLSIAGFGLLRLGFYARRQASRTTTEIVARAAADGGLAKALFEMNRSLAFERWDFSDITSSADGVLSNADANYTYTIEETIKGSEYKITSTGRSGQAERTVSVTVKRAGLFEHAIFAQGYAQPRHDKSRKHHRHSNHEKEGGKLEIDGYNLDGYSSDPHKAYDGNLELKTNSIHDKAVELKNNTVINGDIIVGPGGNPEKVIDKAQDVQITGDTYAAAERTELLSVIVPEKLVKQKTRKYKYKPGKPITGNVKYKDFKLPRWATQKIVGNCTIYVKGDMKLEDGAELIITKNSSLTLYLGKKLEVNKKADGINNETKNPTKLKIYGTDSCTNIKFEDMGDFYGAVYAPRANVEIKDGGDVYGALVGWDVKLQNQERQESHDRHKRHDRHKKHDGHKGQENSTFYFDEALMSSDRNSRFVRAGWREE